MKTITMLSVFGVACFGIAAFVLSSASTIGPIEVVLAALFGFGAFVCAFIVGVIAIANHTKNKVVQKINFVKKIRS